jgi:hypothetical protein
MLMFYHFTQERGNSDSELDSACELDSTYLQGLQKILFDELWHGFLQLTL